LTPKSQVANFVHEPKMLSAFERFSLLLLAGAMVFGIGGAIILRTPVAPLAVATLSASEEQRSENATTASALAAANDVVEPSEYDLEAVAAGAAVPRVFDGSPPKKREAGEHKTREEESWQTILPLVLLVNEDILADRKQLWSIRHNLNLGERLLPEQRIWLEVVSERYTTLGDGLDELARRIDVVPPSIVLAAASKMLQSGAQVAAHGAKSAVAERAAVVREGVGETPHRHDSPLAAVRAYMRTLNTASAYDGFRRERERLRLAGEPLDGLHLAASLPKLPPSNQLSAEELSAMITAHRLTRFDRARLQRSGPAR
jgi:Bax protein